MRQDVVTTISPQWQYKIPDEVISLGPTEHPRFFSIIDVIPLTLSRSDNLPGPSGF